MRLHVTVVSMPNTMKQHWFTHSGMTGFTLPGMMLLPACRAGTLRSSNPVCAGIEQSQVVGGLFQVYGEVLDCLRRGDVSAHIGHGRHGIRRRGDGQPGDGGQMACGGRAEPQVGADAGADGGGAEVQCGQLRDDVFEARRSLFRKLANAWNS